MTNLVILLAGLLPLYVVRFPVLGIPTNLFEVCVWVTALVWLLRAAVSSRPFAVIPGLTRNPRRHMSAVFVFLFLVSAIFSTALSAELRNSLGILKGWILTPIVFGLLVRAATDKKAIIRSLILSGLVVALFGFSQIHGFNRIYSVYDVPNSLALFLVPVSVLAAWLGLKTKNKLYQYAAGVMFIAIVLTQSLGAIVALVGTIVAAVPLIRAQHKGRANLLPEREKGARFAWSLLIIIVIAAFFTLSGRFTYLISPLIHPNTTNSVTVRMQLWDIGIRLIKQYPILGIGLGQFEPAYQAELHRRFAAESSRPPSRDPRRQLQSEFVFRDPHNWIISFWLNLGILGLLSFISLNYIAIKRARNAGIYQQAIALALTSMLIFGLFDTIYWKNDLSALWWMLILYL